MIKLGDLEEEKFLYNKIEEDTEWDETNRGYHLLYYKDVENKTVPYRDMGHGDWKKTYKALKMHICNEDQYYYLGRIDLQIMKKFILTHQDNPFSDSDIKKIDDIIFKKWANDDDYCHSVIDEWNNLKQLVQQ
jgi:hypothetical protein